MKVTLIDCTSNPIKTCEECASVCYDSKPSLAILKACVRSGHTSVLEHANYTFKIEGVSRALLAQITRHRIASYSVRSQRYCKEDYADGAEPSFVIPQLGVPTSEAAKTYMNSIKHSFDAYDILCEIGIKPEDARMVLPNACNTTIMMTINLRSLGNFMGERLCTRAQWEIRKCAQLMKREVLNTMEDDEAEFFGTYWLVPKCEQHQIPICEEHNSCGRHDTIKDIINWKNYFDHKETFQEIERMQLAEAIKMQHNLDMFNKR